MHRAMGPFLCILIVTSTYSTHVLRFADPSEVAGYGELCSVMTTRPIFRLSDREKAHHVESLSCVLERRDLPSRDAVKALESCAILVQDDFMTPHVDHQSIVSLFKAAFGKTPAAIRQNTSLPIDGHGTEEPVYHSSLVRGVVADLDLEMHLVSITVTPHKVREGDEMMGIVGIGQDSRTDVAARHDDYLDKQPPHDPS